MGRILTTRLLTPFTTLRQLPLWPIIPLGLLAWLLSPMATAQFGIIDDHEIVAMLGPDRWLPPWDIPGTFATWGLNFDGRFRPGYYLLRVVESAAWGDHVLLWYGTRFVLAGITIAGIAAFARRLPWPALVALTLMPFAAGEAFYRLGPQEAYALPLLVWGVVLANRWPGVCLLLAAGLVKESFAVVLPFVAVWAWWRDRWTPQVIVLAVGTLSICTAVAVTEFGADFYGQVRTVKSVAKVGAQLAAPFAVSLVPAAIGLFFAPRRVAAALLVAAALFASQAVVYGGFTYSVPVRYLAVGSLGAIIVATVGFRAIPRPFVPIAAVPLLLWGATTLWVQHANAEWWAASTREFQRSLGLIEAHSGPLVITGSPKQPEATLSVGRYLAGPRPPGECAEVILVEGDETGICPTVYLVRWLP